MDNPSKQQAPSVRDARVHPRPKAQQQAQPSPEKAKAQFNQAAEIKNLATEFESCRKILQALGNENRQHLIIEMVKIGKCGGVRVGEITQRTHLSRPTVSHHLHILKDAGIVKVRREGTKNYYYFDDDARALESLMHMLVRAQGIMRSLPDRSICRDCSNLTGCEFCDALPSGASQSHAAQPNTSRADALHPNMPHPGAANAGITSQRNSALRNTSGPSAATTEPGSSRPSKATEPGGLQPNAPESATHLSTPQ